MVHFLMFRFQKNLDFKFIVSILLVSIFVYFMTNWLILVILQKRGISYCNFMSKGKRDNSVHMTDSPHLKRDSGTCFTLIEEHSSEPVIKRNRLDGTNPTESILPLKDSSNDDSGFSASIPGLHH